MGHAAWGGRDGAGQYLTPRALIRAMVECVRPDAGKPIADPACGPGGFFLATYDFIANPDNFNLDRGQKAFLKHKAFHGNEIVANTRRPRTFTHFFVLCPHFKQWVTGEVMLTLHDPDFEEVSP